MPSSYNARQGWGEPRRKDIVARAEAFDYIAEESKESDSVKMSEVSKYLHSNKLIGSMSATDVICGIVTDGLAERNNGKITMTDNGRETYRFLQEADK